MKTNTNVYRGYRFPPEVISHGVWLYHRFCMSFRDIEDLLAERGVVWHLYEVFVKIRGELRYLWRAVDEVMPSAAHDTGQYANNRAEVSHQTTRQRERQMRGWSCARLRRCSLCYAANQQGVRLRGHDQLGSTLRQRYPGPIGLTTPGRSNEAPFTSTYCSTPPSVTK
jgi:putative transposase